MNRVKIHESESLKLKWTGIETGLPLTLTVTWLEGDKDCIQILKNCKEVFWPKTEKKFGTRTNGRRKEKNIKMEEREMRTGVCDIGVWWVPRYGDDHGS